MTSSPEEPKDSDGWVVGIGASAGGLQALEEFFTGMPLNSGLSFVVVQHLSPDFKSLMVELLSRCTDLVVERAQHGMEVQKNHIYLIPPNKSMTISGRVLQLTDRIKGSLTLLIDVFFQSLAEDLEDMAVGVVLSGTGSDGTLGFRAIKGNGGLILCQDAGSAKFDGMPLSAMSNNLVDFVGAPSEIRQKLLAWSEFPQAVTPVEPAPLNGIEEVLSVVRSVHDVDFSVYRRSTIGRRIEKRLQVNLLTDLSRYIQLLRTDPSEIRELYQNLLIGVTRFFRDVEAFDLLRGLLRKMILEMLETEARELRLWSVACSTGEEAYSIVMVMNEVLTELDVDIDFKLFATDINRNALQFASAGVYPESIMGDLPQGMAERYFRRRGNSLIIKDTIRKRVIFSYHNILCDPPFNRLDLLSCRNMLIYFEPEAQQRVLASFAFSLRPDSLLFLGPSETIGDASMTFESLHPRWKVFRRRDSPTPLNLSQGFSYRDTSRRKKDTHRHAPRPAEPERHIFKQIMSRIGPATAIIDDAQQVIMTFGPIAQFLSLPVGSMSLDLTAMTEERLGIMINTAVHRARVEKKRVVYPHVRSNESDTIINLVVEPLLSDLRSSPIYAVVFQATDQSDSSDETAIVLPSNQLLSDLQQELQYTRESLQATIEELETSNEELQATNEELLSSNEELQSTNEELQSVNEELITVNSEHQMKIDELLELNSDMDNFFEATRTWTLFLDRDLAIRKFSPAIGERFKLREGDIGRPLVQFNLPIQYPNFEDDLKRVMITLEPVSEEVLLSTGEWFTVSIAPYRTRESRVYGLVLSFTDITRRRQDAQELETYRVALATLRTSRGMAPFEKRRILMVEDDEDVAELLRLKLAEHQLSETLDVAGTIAEAMAVLDKSLEPDTLEPEIVLLDLSLPDGDGLQILDHIKANSALQHIPVVILSVTDDVLTVRRAYEHGASGFVSKPSSAVLLPAVLSTLREYWFTVARLPKSGGSA